MFNNAASVDIYCELVGLWVAYNGVEALGVSEEMAENGVMGLYALLELGLDVGWGRVSIYPAVGLTPFLYELAWPRIDMCRRLNAVPL